MITNLTVKDLGHWVTYTPKNEKGVIKSFSNDKKIAWVVYHCDENWKLYKDYTGASTKYEDLVMGKHVKSN